MLRCQHTKNRIFRLCYLMSSDSALAACFKSYDIRGSAPEQINAAFARRLSYALVAHLQPKTVLVGRDMRTTSFALESALVDGLASSGVDVVRIGMCSTPMFNVLIGLSDGAFELGVMVTASHNPGRYNGFKLTRGDCMPIGSGSGMEEIREKFFRQDVERKREDKHMGSITDDSTALDTYVNHILSLVQFPSDVQRMKIAIDAGNGMAGAVLPRLLSRLPWLEVLPLYFTLDGTFPNHEANPLKRETLVRLCQIVRDEACVMGIAYDGDADRVGFVDETGTPIPGDVMTALLAQEFLREHTGGRVLYDIRSSWSVPETITAAGGVSEMTKVGHANIKRHMRETGAIFGGELSMHFYFSQLWNCESGDLAMLLMLQRMARDPISLSRLRKSVQRYVHSGEVNFEVQDTQAVIDRVRERYLPQASSVSTLDGIRLEFRQEKSPSLDWWFNLRASNTEPLLRLNAEARTESALAERMSELSLVIQA